MVVDFPDDMDVEDMDMSFDDTFADKITMSYEYVEEDEEDSDV